MNDRLQIRGAAANVFREWDTGDAGAGTMLRSPAMQMLATTLIVIRCDCSGTGRGPIT